MFQKNSNLAALILKKGCTIKDIKLEALLVVCYDLFTEYINSFENNTAKPLLIEDDKKNDEYIYLIIKDILINLEKKINTTLEITEILEKASRSKPNYSLAKLVEPIAFFHTKLVLRLKLDVNQYCKEENSQKVFWMPELLAFNLLNDIKEHNYSFRKFTFFEDINFEKIFIIYRDYSKRINSFNNSATLEKNKKKRNLIAKMNLMRLFRVLCQ